MHPIEIPERPRDPLRRWSLWTAAKWGGGLKLAFGVLTLANAALSVQQGRAVWPPGSGPLLLVGAEIMGAFAWAGVFAVVAAIRNALVLPAHLKRRPGNQLH